MLLPATLHITRSIDNTGRQMCELPQCYRDSNTKNILVVSLKKVTQIPLCFRLPEAVLVHRGMMIGVYWCQKALCCYILWYDK